MIFYPLPPRKVISENNTYFYGGPFTPYYKLYSRCIDIEASLNQFKIYGEYDAGFSIESQAFTPKPSSILTAIQTFSPRFISPKLINKIAIADHVVIECNWWKGGVSLARESILNAIDGAKIEFNKQSPRYICYLHYLKPLLTEIEPGEYVWHKQTIRNFFTSY